MTDKIKLKADKFVNGKKLKLNYIKPKDLKLLLAEFCEEQIAGLKAECDLAIEGRDVKIKELESTVGTLRTFNNEQASCIESLKAQIEKMKRCYTCKHHTGLGYCKLKQNNGVCENHDKWEFGENDKEN